MIDLADGISAPAARRITTRLARQALITGDAHIARDLLAHETRDTALTTTGRTALLDAMRSAGLGQGPTPPSLHADFMAATETAESVMRRAVTRFRATAHA